MANNSDLPAEVMGVLPESPIGMIELANKITAFAYSQKVATIEAEAQQLREAVISKQNSIKSLERRVSMLELEVQELAAKNKQGLDEQHRLQAEKVALIDTVKKFNREVAKLESFKKSLLQHLQEDDEQAPTLDRGFAAVDMSSERLVADVLQSASKPGGAMAAGVRANMPPFLSHGGVSSPGYPSSSGRAASPGRFSPSPTQQPQTSPGMAPAGPPDVKIDGKEFFRRARERLSYEQFSFFLQNIKELNAGRQTRDETLQRAADIFGVQHNDLYVLFEGLLSKHISTF
uniref:At4g15545-like C-terminal domain-containing protein n=1 Tax=Dunaliella tertiolecta TaxID=3047 RepID=A0A7S3QWD5_DUNTE|eukprot:CAMPEP_0202382254 /NCGR_PEP_ID=MMETSP1127-20130417/42002_1 /ASSEMBLY_ACC=CAM_ASM_000462 /TAXON_ID=3047 /ORGANISM="Dunaliella tertiolecta, Strain CCMP1320" /LENGTH=288 /DNA_ID=CAMNT_0048981409 /DNA_START=21 /DNA_END=887 /DNA_ORIENTATION=+